MSEIDIFDAAYEISDPDERARYLDEACGADLARRRRIERLIRQAQRSDGFLEPDTAQNSLASSQSGTQLRVGATVGPFRLVETLGEGGMGIVYVAEQETPVRRRVALKVIKPGMDSRQVLARFDAERQVLALMDHPNIAKVLDAGTTEQGLPYFVMELVNGVPINRYCDEKKLTIEQRLILFRSVCEGVQHAHQKGIIHRDLKPTNILIAQYDGRPMPKVIDFGVAKATGQSLSEHSAHTQLGQIVGTIEYMSPEQAQWNQLDIDTRSDIYSLGVVLFELLTGDLPFEKSRLRNAALDELFRIIREEEPPRPSTRVSTSQSKAEAAKNRQADPARLGALFRGELDWIVMKALEKERGRRYETANGLAADISRYLENETVQACPPTTGYRLAKFWRRNRTAVSVGVLVTAFLVGSSVVSTWLAKRARHAEAKAVAREEEVNLANLALTRTQQESERNFQFALAGMQEFFADFANSMSSANDSEKQRLLFVMAARFRELTEHNPHQQGLSIAYANVLLEIGKLAVQVGDWTTARDSFANCIAVRSQVEPEVSDHEAFVSHYHSIVDAYEGLAAAWIDQDESKSERFILQAVQNAEKAADAIETTQTRNKLALTRNHFGILLAKMGRVDEAMRQYQLALPLADGALRAAVLHNLALIEESRGQFKPALKLIDEAAQIPGQSDRRVEAHLLEKAKLHVLLGEFAEAKRPCEKARGLVKGLELIRWQLRSGSRDYIISDLARAERSHLETSVEVLQLLAKIYAELGEIEATVDVLERAVWLCRFSLPAKPVDKGELQLIRDLEESLGTAYLAMELDQMANRHFAIAAALEQNALLYPVPAEGVSFQIGGHNGQYLEAVGVDDSGAIFTGGSFARRTDVDPGVRFHGLPDNASTTVCRYSRDGKIQWVRGLGTPANGIVEDMALDGKSNILVVGHLTTRSSHDTIQFGKVKLKAPEEYEGKIAFVAKLTPEGHVTWAKWVGRGKSPNVIEDVSVCITPDNRVWVGGTFSFNSQVGDQKQSLDLPHSDAGSRRGYVACINEDGTVNQVHSIKGDAESIVSDISSDADGNIYICGASAHIGSTIFGPDSAGNVVQLREVNHPELSAGFLMSLTSSGTVRWVRPQVNDGPSRSMNVVAGQDGRIYLTTRISGDTDLDGLHRHPDERDLVKPRTRDLNGTSLSCWNREGDFLWHRRLGKRGREVSSFGMAARNGGGLFLTCFISGELLFFDDLPLPRYTSGTRDSFVMEIDSDGELKTHWFFVSEGAMRIRGLGVNRSNQVVVSGNFVGPVLTPTGEYFKSLGGDGIVTLIEPGSSSSPEK